MPIVISRRNNDDIKNEQDEGEKLKKKTERGKSE